MAVRAADVEATASRILDELERAVIGKRRALELVVLALIADGHILIEDLPGLAKTLMARSLARVCALDFARIQFTPDLMPSDVTGSSVYVRRDEELRFMPGPVFTNLLLADEVNRAPAKTQAALLEAMQERQVTLDGHTRDLERPFLVIATQNPIEYEGTYALPEAQLDRFMLRLSVGYPERADEQRLLLSRAERASDEVDLDRVCDRETLLALQAAVNAVHVAPAVADYIVDVVASTRAAPQLDVGASPRGSLALLKLSRARAAVRGRDFVVPDDVKAVAVPALAHRVLLSSDLWVQRISSDDVVAELVEGVAVPVADFDAGP
jgi:MoxR-like ATPase